MKVKVKDILFFVLFVFSVVLIFCRFTESTELVNETVVPFSKTKEIIL